MTGTEMYRHLGSFETAQALTYETHTFNLVLLLRLENAPDQVLLEPVLQHLCRRHPLIAGGIRKKGKSWCFVSGAGLPIPLKTISSGKEDQWQQVVSRELEKPLDVALGPLMRVTLIRNTVKSSCCSLILTLHHAAADGAYATALVDELLDLWQEAADSGLREPVPPEKISGPADNYLPAKKKKITWAKKKLGFMLRLAGEELAFRTVNAGMGAARIPLDGRPVVMSLCLEKESSAALCRISRRRRISLHSILCAALIQSVKKQLYPDRSMHWRHFMMADLRPFLQPALNSFSPGSYFSMIRVTLGLKKKETFWELAKKIEKRNRRVLKRGDKFLFMLKSPLMMKTLLKMRSFRMGHTAMNYAGVPVLRPERTRPVLKNLHVFVSNFPLGPEFTAQVRLFNQEFVWDFLFLAGDMEPELGKKIACQVLDLLNAVGGRG